MLQNAPGRSRRKSNILLRNANACMYYRKNLENFILELRNIGYIPW